MSSANCFGHPNSPCGDGLHGIRVTQIRIRKVRAMHLNVIFLESLMVEVTVSTRSTLPESRDCSRGLSDNKKRLEIGLDGLCSLLFLMRRFNNVIKVWMLF